MQRSKQPKVKKNTNNEELVKPSYEYANYDIDCLYEIFNENSKYYRATMTGIGMRIANFLTNPSTIKLHISGVKNYGSFKTLELPEPPDAPQLPLTAALAQRRSKPAFGKPISAEELSSLLKLSLATNYKTIPSFAPDEVMYRKPFASGGGLYPVEFYVVIVDVIGLPACVAHFDWINNQLKIIREINKEEVNAVMTLPFAAGEEPSAIIFMSGVFQRSTNKYGNKGYKFAMIEAGCAGQTLQLVATSLGLNSLFWSSFFDDEAENLLGIDGVNESVITSFVVGKA
ncbi:SagB/ThcOx family dehydrogenase [Undibacterium flavidum]|uniref:SagB/ThcOx family dehydrogenase n=1 Tax=Undibacterium flavidum TaxID=2762297 RepID=A0ABR6YAZ0_9BURK|nr:SagB/ThcOx family dehydrogenase [Undibacterium flavidum]MBC3873805.1 SagB/ThcOx family dehydrogenase [Undibacterium flavidum]